MQFGRHIRKVREKKKRTDPRFSVRQVAARIGVEPAYLSKVEREEVSPPSEEKIRRLAAELGGDPDLLLAMAGKVPGDLKEIILGRPKLFCPLLRKLGSASEKTLHEIAGRVR